MWRARTRKTWRGLIEREKEDALDGWDLTEGEPVAYVPLDWRLAFGGRHAEDASQPTRSASARGRSALQGAAGLAGAADRVGRSADPLRQRSTATSWLRTHLPLLEGPAVLAGTYGDDWLETRHPLLPEDFDYSFWQAAPRDQIAEPWLKGNEPFELTNLLPGYEQLCGLLPNIALSVSIDQGGGPQSGLMALDGVHFDMRPGIGRCS